MLHGVPIILNRQRIENIGDEKILIGMTIRQERSGSHKVFLIRGALRYFANHLIFDISQTQRSSIFRKPPLESTFDILQTDVRYSANRRSIFCKPTFDILQTYPQGFIL
jgi:hypothetical protein